MYGADSPNSLSCCTLEMVVLWCRGSQGLGLDPGVLLGSCLPDVLASSGPGASGRWRTPATLPRVAIELCVPTGEEAAGGPADGGSALIGAADVLPGGSIVYGSVTPGISGLGNGIGDSCGVPRMAA